MTIAVAAMITCMCRAVRTRGAAAPAATAGVVPAARMGRGAVAHGGLVPGRGLLRLHLALVQDVRLLVREALVGVRLRLERDKTKASGTLGYVVAEHERVGHFAEAGEVVLERLVGRVET